LAVIILHSFGVFVLSKNSFYHPAKVTVVGTGSVGASFAYSLMIQGFVSEISLIDIDQKKAMGEAMDLEHGMPFVQPVRISAGGYSECEGADIVVVTAGAAQKPGESRLDLVQKNFSVFQKVIPEIVAHNKSCILLVATNPVDIMTYVSLKLSGFPSERVLGSGTILDTLRLRSILGDHFKLDPRNVHAYIIGEHGDSEVPVWSSANVAGMRLAKFCPFCGERYDPQYFAKVFDQVKNAAYKIIEYKGSTYYGIGLGLTRIVESIVRDENAILAVSSLLDDYYGVSDICLSVPSIVNSSGVARVLKLPLDDLEIQQFQKSASILKDIAKLLVYN
jgi:L-lactate dehydrogenase